ncbi:MAG: hypothetical protein ABMB14_26730 [Myxococcota bacterium]
MGALAVEDSPYGGRPLPDDEAFLVHPESALDLADLRVRGARRAWIAGRMRRPFLGWLAALARERRSRVVLRYVHERGDWSYELATWTWDGGEALSWAAYDGGSNAIATGWVYRPAPPDQVAGASLRAAPR